MLAKRKSRVGGKLGEYTSLGMLCRYMRRQKVWFFTPWGTPYDGLYGEAPPERGTFFRLQVYERVAFHSARYIKG